MATEIVKADQMNASFQGMSQLPVIRQVGLLIGLAASLAIAIYVVMWSQSPNLSVLFNQVQNRDMSEIVSVLEREGIEYQVDTGAGVVMVESSQVHQARIVLAKNSLPSQAGMGFSNEDSALGSSNFVLNIQYQQQLEANLAQTIMELSAVSNARVHLALPKQTAFLQDHRKPSASVFVELATGQNLNEEYIAAIMHLVASSVPNLSSENVTVVDGKGRLLSKQNESAGVGLSSRQFQYKKNIETDRITKIENILSPIVGVDNIRAQVVVEVDFTSVEITQETYNPDQTSVRNEHRVEEKSLGSNGVGGVPGALSNEPPGAGVAPENATGAAGSANGGAPSRTTVRVTTNNELDRSIVHKKMSPSSVKRLSIAVVIDNKQVFNAEGVAVSTAYTPEEMAQFTSLVKEAVGFNELRGDTVNVVNAEFVPPAPIEPAAEVSFLEQAWVWDVGKQLLGGLVAAFILFGILKPIMRNLARMPAAVTVAEGPVEGDALDDDQVTLSGNNDPRLPKPNEYESDLDMAKSMIVQEPKRVAQVVKQWVNADSE